jgi:DNA-binding protein YbaB
VATSSSEELRELTGELDRTSAEIVEQSFGARDGIAHVKLNGELRVERVKLDRKPLEALDSKQVRELEQSLATAFNTAADEARAHAVEQLAAFAGRSGQPEPSDD